MQSIWLFQMLVLLVFRPVNGIGFEVFPMGINLFDFIHKEEKVLLVL